MGHYVENTGTTPLRFLEVQEQLLRRCLAECLDGVNATRAGERTFETWSAGDGRAAQDESARRAALDQPEVTDKSDRRAASGLPRGGCCCYGKSAQLSTQGTGFRIAPCRRPPKLLSQARNALSPARNSSSPCATAAKSTSTASASSDVTTHPAFRNSAASVALLYDALHDAKHQGRAHRADRYRLRRLHA